MEGGGNKIAIFLSSRRNDDQMGHFLGPLGFWYKSEKYLN
jgi:hypothetical protein